MARCYVTVRTYLCLLLFLCTVEKVPAQSQREDCQTPSYEAGQCVKLKDCEPLLELLKKRPVLPKDADILRRLACGFEGNFPKVCCPLSSSPQSTTTKPFPTDRSFDENGQLPSSFLPNLFTCGVMPYWNKIFGGGITSLRDFPWTALIEYRTNSGSAFHCEGVLINDRYVLTAAHCLKGKDLPSTWKLTKVRLGEYNIDTDVDCDKMFGNPQDCAPPPVDIPVEELIPYEKYDPFSVNQYHDIALLRLSERVNYSDFIRPVCLPLTQKQLTMSLAGTSMFMASWGKAETNSSSNIKVKLKVPIKSNADCAPIYKTESVTIGDGQMCAGGDQSKDSCRGTSGAALMDILGNDDPQNWFALGVVSFGPTPCGTENWPGVYTRVTKYVDWITSKLRP